MKILEISELTAEKLEYLCKLAIKGAVMHTQEVFISLKDEIKELTGHKDHKEIKNQSSELTQPTNTVEENIATVEEKKE